MPRPSLAPTGADLILDICKSSNQGSTWTIPLDEQPQSNRPTIVVGVKHGGGTSFDTTTFSAGDWLRFDVMRHWVRRSRDKM